jgi:hypothetical protein
MVLRGRSKLDGAALAVAVGSCSTLQSLTLEELPGKELAALVLCQLNSHTHLQKLSLAGCSRIYKLSDVTIAHDDAMVHAVSAMLQSRIVPLQALELKRVHFSRAGMENLVPGLETCTSLVELRLDGGIADEAQQQLVRFLRVGRGTTACPIRLLSLNALQGGPNLFVSILSTNIGMSLHSLILPSWFNNIDALLNALVTGEHHLLSLSLGSLTDICWSQLTHSLPSMLHLRKLCLMRVSSSHVSSADFVNAMRKNGSLHQVVSEISFYVDRRYNPLFSAAELQQIQTYCQRNRSTRELLQNPSLPCDDTNVAKTLLSLFPMLFRAMQPAARMTPNYALVGLLACSSILGPNDHGHRKRLGPHSSRTGRKKVLP